MTAALSLVCMAAHARADDYPTRAVRIIVGFPAGASGDLLSRAVGARLSQTFGQQFVIENRPGASSSIAAESAARAAKDGYTLFLGTVANVVNAAITPNLAFDFAKDFAPIALAAVAPVMLVVHPSTGVKTLPELIALAKTKPGEMFYASSGTATTPASRRRAAQRPCRHQPHARALSGRSYCLRASTEFHRPRVSA